MPVRSFRLARADAESKIAAMEAAGHSHVGITFTTRQNIGRSTEGISFPAVSLPNKGIDMGLENQDFEVECGSAGARPTGRSATDDLMVSLDPTQMAVEVKAAEDRGQTDGEKRTVAGANDLFGNDVGAHLSRARPSCGKPRSSGPFEAGYSRGIQPPEPPGFSGADLDRQFLGRDAGLNGPRCASWSISCAPTMACRSGIYAYFRRRGTPVPQERMEGRDAAIHFTLRARKRFWARSSKPSNMKSSWAANM